MHELPRRLLYVCVIASVMLAPAALFSQDSAELSSNILQLNQQLQSFPKARSASRRLTLTGDPQLAAMVKQRQALVEALIKSDPAAVRSVMLTAEQADEIIATSPESASAIETENQWEGELEQLVEDDFAHGASRTHWILHTTSNQRIELSLVNANSAPNYRSRTVAVNGVGTTNVVAAERVQISTAAGPSAPVTSCSTLGTQNTAVLLMNQPGGPAFPSTLGTAPYWTPQYFSSTPKSVTTFWQETSFGQTSNAGQVYGPFNLDQNYTCDQYDNMAIAAITAAKTGGVDFSQYNNISIIFPVASCSYGGLGRIGCNSDQTGLINHPYSVSWIAALTYYDSGYQLWGLLAHELGHNLGLNHSSSLDFGTLPLGALDYTESGTASNGATAIRTEYGDPYTVMGGGSYTCGWQYSAFNKELYLDWIDPASVQEVTSNGSFSVVPYEGNSGTRALRVLRDPLTSSWLWMEYRQATGTYDAESANGCVVGNARQGALTYYEGPLSSDGHLFLIDFNATSVSNDFTNAALTPGHSWSDPYSLLTLTANSANGSNLSISASYDQPCASLQISASTFVAAGGSGTITVTAPQNCAWTATTAASWINLTGTKSGSGNGTIPFSVANNSSTRQKNGYITVQRQSLAIAQRGTGPFIPALSPTFQTGTAGTVVVSLDDPLGTADIDQARIHFQDTNCEVYVSQSGSQIFLFVLDNTTGTYSSSLTPGQNKTISNSNCSVTGPGTTVSRNGNVLQLSLNMGFTQAFSGSHRVSATLCGLSLCTDEVSIGTWQVALPATVSSVTPNNGRQTASVPIVITGANSHFTNFSTLAVSGSGVTVSGISASSPTQLNATLTIASNATLGSRTLTITTGVEVVTSSFTVNGIGIGSLSPPTLSAAHQQVHTTSGSQLLTFTNTGAGMLNIAGITTTAEFGVTTNCGATLAVAATCNVNVTFQPLFYGLRTGTVSVSDDGPGSPHTASLSGFGDLLFTPVRPIRVSHPTPSQNIVITTDQPMTIPVRLSTASSVAAAPSPASSASSNTTQVSCTGNRRVACNVMPDVTGGIYNVVVTAAATTPPGDYSVVLNSTDESGKQTMKVPVKVSKAFKHKAKRRSVRIVKSPSPSV